MSTSPGTGVNFTTQLTGGVNQQWFFQPYLAAENAPTPILSAVGNLGLEESYISNGVAGVAQFTRKTFS